MTAAPDSDAIVGRVRMYANLITHGPAVSIPCCPSAQVEGDDWYHDTKCPIAKALRQEWCTPKWLAELIGEVDLDPCSNKRSHIRARYRSDVTADGFKWNVAKYHDVFINPPYGPGSVIRWVRAFAHTRHRFLLRWDPSTDWFAELYKHTTHIWHPGERINFEPPPHIRASSNAYPHALFMRNPNPDLLERLLSRGGYLNQIQETNGILNAHRG